MSKKEITLHWAVLQLNSTYSPILIAEYIPARQ